MGVKEVYNCNICRDDMPVNELVGVNFSGMKTFKLDSPRSTKGVHICFECLAQINEQAEEFLKSPAERG